MAEYVRTLTDEESAQIVRLARSRTAPAQLVQRAQIIERSSQHQRVARIAEALGVCPKTVRRWIDRFSAQGLAGLDDAPRAGRPRTYTETQYGQVLAKARSAPPPPAGGEVAPSCHWTLDRLEADLAKEGLAIKRSQIRRILKAEHVKWQHPRTWLTSDDPEFAEKRGPSSSGTPSRLPTAPSCVSTSTVPSAPGATLARGGATLPIAPTSRRTMAATASSGPTAP